MTATSIHTALNLVFALIAAAASAQPAPPPAAVTDQLAELTGVYRAAPAADRMTVRAWDASGSTTETVTVRTDPGRLAVVEFAGLRAFVTPHVLVVERLGDQRRAFIAPAHNDPAGAFREYLPGVPALQVALAFNQSGVLPWPFDVPAARTRLSAAADGRFRFASTELGTGRRVTISAESIDPGDPAEWLVELSGRRRVTSVRDLATPAAPSALDGTTIRVGDDAPTLLLLAIDMQPWILGSRDAGAVAVVLCRAQTPGAAAGYGAALDVAERDDAPLGYTAILGVCGEPFNVPLMDHLRDLRFRWGSRVKWTVSPETTIDLFAPDHDAVLVLIDALDSVRAIIPLDGRGADQSALEAEIVAALAGP